MRLLCRLGWHYWEIRELHAEEQFPSEALFIKMAIIERCPCGASRMPRSGYKMLTSTSLFVSEKFNVFKCCTNKSEKI